MSDLDVLSAEVVGPHACKAWALLERAAARLVRSDPHDAPAHYVRSVVAMRGWLERSIDPTGDALLHAATAVATHHDLPERGALALILGARAANRGDLGSVPGLIRKAESISPRTPALDLLDTHIAIRTGRVVNRGRLRDRAMADPTLRLQLALSLVDEQSDIAVSMLERFRNAEATPIAFGVASFFLAELSARHGAWPAVLTYSTDAERGLGFMGHQPYRWALCTWRARALRNLDQRKRARIEARTAYAQGHRLGIAEVMVEAAIELAELSSGIERNHWQGEVTALLPGSVRPEVHKRAAPLLQKRPRTDVQVDAYGRWLDGVAGRVDLSGRSALRRVLRALVDSRERGSLGVHELFVAGWPGENIMAASRQKRVHTAIWQLRRLGMGEHLVRHTEGYALSSTVFVVW